MPYCLETKDLTYHYHRGEPILNAVNLHVEEGSIYGFLGPNGAGKTTTLRLILGLLEMQNGNISIFGADLKHHRIDILKKIGSLIETPSLYSHLTAYENLDVQRRVYRCPKDNIYDALKMVGLDDTKNKKAGQFSLGMKQRLSIAMALLHRPRLLILDEPTNGLDPNGIIEMRALLKRLNQEQQITIVISSHLLSEIEKLVTHIGIIHQGSLRFQGTLAELNTLKQPISPVVFETNNTLVTLSTVEAQGFHAIAHNENVFVTGIARTDIPGINATLVSKGVDVFAIHTESNDLEKIFMDIVNP
jgi:ABC-2 type transport system ATP-binding protein